MLILKIITYVFAFGAAIGQFALDYVVSDRESILYKRTRIVLFIMLVLSLMTSIGLLVKEDIRSDELSNQVGELKGLIVSKDNNSMTREQKAQYDRDKLLIEVNLLNNKIEPFIMLAKKKYPQADIDNALKNLMKEFIEIKAIAGPNILKFQKYSVRKEGSNYVLKMRFKPEKNVPLGIIQIVVHLPLGSGSKIVNIWPNAEGGAFQTGNESKVITDDGNSARVIYSLLGAGFPTIDVTVTKLVPMKIFGNNGLDEFILKPEMN